MEKRTKRQRRFPGLLCVLLAMILCFGTVTVHASPFSYRIEITAKDVPNSKLIKNEEIVSGTIRYGHPHDVYKFSVDKVSKVEFEKQNDEGPLPLWILDDKGYVLSSLMLDYPINTLKISLMPGTYILYVGYEENYSVGDPVPYTLKSHIFPIYESFPETAKDDNDHPSRADRIALNDIVNGVLCRNEPGYLREQNNHPTDFYQFEVYGSVPHKMRVEIWHPDCPLEFYILKDDMNRIAYRPTPDFYGSKYDNIFTLDPGTYYLGIEAGDNVSGGYFFCVSDIETSPTNYGTVYTTVGSEQWVFNRIDTLGPNCTNVWESLDPSVAVMHGDNLYGTGAGRTKVYSYSEMESMGHIYSYHFAVDAFVEFTDVQHQAKNPYYYDPVYWAVDYGITGGIKDKDGLARTFAPGNDCTRAQIVAFLWRMNGCPEPKTITDFKDVKKSDYYYKAVSWAQENGITGGYTDGTFRPGNKCSRAQIVTFLWRMKGCPKMTGPSEFTDVTNKNAYYYQAVLWASENGITGGYSDHTFRPENICSRGQTVTFLYRYYDKFVPKG